MPNDKPTLCPFEIEHHGKVVVCEGVGEWERLIHEFEDRMAMIQWRREFCTYGTYRACPYYQAVMVCKYPEETAL